VTREVVLVETMVAAFAGDPLYAWLQPDPLRRAALLREVLAFVLALGLEHGEVHTTAARDAVAVWTEPGVALVGDAAAERYLDLLREHVGEERLGDLVAGMTAVDRHRPAAPHRTLHSVAVHPGTQGAGVGSALLRPMLERCDAEGVGVYLDSSCSRNLPFYARLGFRVVSEERLPDGGPVMRTLLRASSRG
jgi:GNAT superfamily N-acetyltransferase